MEIRARSLTRSFPAPGRFGLSFRRQTAIREVGFRVREGEIVALAGENGSGKTTTLRLLAGLLRPDSGQALLGGRPAVRPRARQGLGYAAEEDEFPPALKAGAVLCLSAALAGLSAGTSRKECARVAAALDLEAWLGVPAARCSRGIRRRLSLAQALLGHPSALLLDEPLTGLDPVARARALAAIRAAARSGAAVLASLHDPGAILALADRLILLRGGRVAEAGPVSDFLPGESGNPPETADWLAAALSASRPSGKVAGR